MSASDQDRPGTSDEPAGAGGAGAADAPAAAAAESVAAPPAADAGTQTVAWLRDEQLRVDDAWAVATPAGFTWWPDMQAQTIEVVGSEQAGPGGPVGHFVSVKTELLRSVELDTEGAAVLSDALMLSSAMTGVVYDEAERTLALHSLVTVTDENMPWMRSLLGAAAMMQIAEARAIAPQLAGAMNAAVPGAGHPEKGPRPEPAPIVGAIFDLLVAPGQEPCRWTKDEFQQAFEGGIDQPPAVGARLEEKGGWVVQVPIGGEFSVICRVLSSESHPRYGNGLFVLQQFPLTPPTEEDGIGLALALNGLELGQRPFGYGFGSYAARNKDFYFLSFLPNAVYVPGLLLNIHWSCIQRVQAVHAVLSSQEVEE